jgi:hypothetical protein
MTPVGNPRRKRKRVPSPNCRRALELLAASRDGCTEAILVAHGFTIDLLVELVRAGLATAKAERVVAGGRSMEVARVRITEAGGGRSHHNAGKDNGRSATTRTTSGLYRARGYPICQSETDPSAHRA